MIFYSVSCLKEGKVGKIVFAGKQQMVRLCSRIGGSSQAADRIC